MSIEAINWALNRVTGITSTQKSILIALADRANADHQCWPSYEDICFRSGANRKSVVSALHRLEELGLLSRQRRFSKSNVYTLAISKDFGSIQRFRYRTHDESDIGHIGGPKIGPLTINESSKEPPEAKHSRKVPEGVDPDVWKDWVQYRKKFKAPCTDRSLTIVANKLKEMSFYEQRECVDRAIECGWKSVFPRAAISSSGELIV